MYMYVYVTAGTEEGVLITKHISDLVIAILVAICRIGDCVRVPAPNAFSS